MALLETEITSQTTIFNQISIGLDYQERTIDFFLLMGESGLAKR